jgi:hypothetical protein
LGILNRTNEVAMVNSVRAPVGTVINAATAAYNNPGQAGIGVAKSFLNLGPGLANLSINGAKLSLQGWAAIGNAAGLISNDVYSSFANSKPLQFNTFVASNDAQKFGQYGTDLALLLAGGAAAEAEAAVIGERVDQAFAFYNNTGMSESDILSHLEGIDFGKQIEVQTLEKGTQLVQYAFPGRPTGQYFAPLGTDPATLGIDPAGRVATIYEAQTDVTVLRSTAADTSGNTSLPSWARGSGGGTQYFVPDNAQFKPLLPPSGH